MGAAYLAVVFGGLQVADPVFRALGLGPRVFNGAVLASLLGFPLVVALAWMFDITPRGIRRTTPAEASDDAPVADRWSRVKAALVGAGFMGVVWFGVHLWQAPGPGANGAPTTGVRPVLAVLPFQDFSRGGDHAYFADGLHEELLHQLALVKGIQLIPRTSMNHFAGSLSNVRTIADSLGAGWVLEGGVRASADSVRVTVQLIDGHTDQSLWSEAVSAPFSVEGIFALQEGIARRVSHSLGGTLAGGEVPRPEDLPTRSIDAYTAFLTGLYHWNLPGGDHQLEALGDFRRAVSLDPDFGRAWGLVGLMAILAANNGTLDKEEAYPLLREAAARAVELAPEEPESHLAELGVRWTLERDWPGALREIQAALDLNPDLVVGRSYLAQYYNDVEGDWERAIREVDKALALDPFNTNTWWTKGRILYCAGLPEREAEVYRRILEIAPDEPYPSVYLAETLAEQGKIEEAVAVASPALGRLPKPVAPDVAEYYLAVGDTTRARVVVDSFVAARERGEIKGAAEQVAVGYAYLGDVEEALDWLGLAVDQEHKWYLRSPAFRNIRADARFRTLWEKAALPGEPEGCRGAPGGASRPGSPSGASPAG